MAQRDSLTLYRKKRDFSKTPEPEGQPEAGQGRRYLIQKHAATRLHYDFRLELGGVLKSWAVTRGPSLDPHEKRLAVEVEDHPVAYGGFEGSIPKGQYGGGTVMLWDEGSWEPLGDPQKGLAKGKLEFRLHGKRLHGEWTLVRMRPREKDKGRNNWLLIKRTDAEAKPGDNDKLLEKNATSIASGRSMEKIAAAKGSVWQGKPKRGTAEKTAAKKIPPEKTSRLPGFIAPQLATLSAAMPTSHDWVHEIKFDGYRALAYVQNGKARIFTRSGLDWTHKFGALAHALATLPNQPLILDGEIVAITPEGRSSFKALQRSLGENCAENLQYYVFDLLYRNGADIMPMPLLARKRHLRRLLKKPLAGKIFYSEHVNEYDASMLTRLCGMELEGVISKQADAPYRSGRGTLWLKTKCHRRQEFVIGGFTEPAHAGRGIGALLIGYRKGGAWIYAGKVGTGFDTKTSMALRRKLDALRQRSMPFAGITPDGRRGASWVKPELVCEVEFTEWTPEGRLRHPSFQGLREDKPATEVGRDEAKAGTEPMPKNPKGSVAIGGIIISHPDRHIYPGTDITKARLAEYYHHIAPHILPHVKGRPLSMLRCPEGAGEPCFFQRHIARGQSPHLYDAGVPVKGRDENYMMIKDEKGLITLVQWGVIELHPWGCLADKPTLPDRMVFDLDPDPAVPFAQVMAGAGEVRERMQEFGLRSFVKTTGGKGLHVVMPLTRAYGWGTVKAFARAVAESMQRDTPGRYIAKASKEARKGKIFVDYLRNDLTATAVAAFSARAREAAPVAMPLDWSELKASLRPAAFTIETVPSRLAGRRADPWEEFFTLRQKLSARHLRALGIEPE